MGSFKAFVTHIVGLRPLSKLLWANAAVIESNALQAIDGTTWQRLLCRLTKLQRAMQSGSARSVGSASAPPSIWSAMRQLHGGDFAQPLMPAKPCLN